MVFGEVSYEHSSGVFGALDFLYVDDMFANNANTAISETYTVANLRFGLDTTLGMLIVSPFIGVNNLFDEVYNSNLRINAFGGRYFEPGPDRNIYAGVELRYDFR
jgi:iron complex outermembrane receptor protein